MPFVLAAALVAGCGGGGSGANSDVWFLRAGVSVSDLDEVVY